MWKKCTPWSFLLLSQLILLKSPGKYQQSIPGAILHRSWYPNFFLTQNFSMKKIISKNRKNKISDFQILYKENIFSFEKIKIMFSKENIFSFDKIWKIWNFKFFIFFQFSKIFFSSKNFELKKKLDHYVDVKFAQESIAGIFRRIGAILTEIEAKMLRGGAFFSR